MHVLNPVVGARVFVREGLSGFIIDRGEDSINSPYSRGFLDYPL